MNEEAKKWVKFLKTNPKKETGQLMDQSKRKRCCLGWALKTLKTDLKEYNLEETGLSGNTQGQLNYKEAHLLGLRSTTGFIDEAGDLTYKGELIHIERGEFEGDAASSLAEINDFTDFNHKQIAEVIEENQEFLFQREA